jgi:hypothetical protein
MCVMTLAIYAPMIYTAPCKMFWMRAYTLRGQVGGGWAPEIESFLGPVSQYMSAIWGQKTQDFQGPSFSHLPYS